ncbi:MAG: hypothetical protein KAK04_15270 [Cyclobacteriaceae bacterium]|nr:hypothetical protein [Cyclobacteriaceae bacterium]
MNKSKRIFLAFAVVFFLAMIIISYDISKRTTYPGSKKLLIESLVPSDSTETDSTKIETDINELKN